MKRKFVAALMAGTMVLGSGMGVMAEETDTSDYILEEQAAGTEENAAAGEDAAGDDAENTGASGEYDISRMDESLYKGSWYSFDGGFELYLPDEWRQTGSGGIADGASAEDAAGGEATEDGMSTDASADAAEDSADTADVSADAVDAAVVTAAGEVTEDGEIPEESDGIVNAGMESAVLMEMADPEHEEHTVTVSSAPAESQMTLEQIQNDLAAEGWAESMEDTINEIPVLLYEKGTTQGVTFLGADGMQYTIEAEPYMEDENADTDNILTNIFCSLRMTENGGAAKQNAAATAGTVDAEAENAEESAAENTETGDGALVIDNTELAAE